MTLIYGEARNCALCGASSEQFALSSTNALGSPDLDLRPPPMQRDTMEFWLQECPKCGYINDDIQRELFGAKEVVNSASYRSLCAPQPVPVLASRFERFALLKQTVLPVEAGWARLHAAWVCDDHRKKGRAMEHRKACAEIWSKVAWAEDEEGIRTQAVLVDVFRRARRFEQSITLANKLLESQRLSKVIDQVLRFELVLASSADGAAHRVEEAVDDSKLID